ncbi:MAG: DUF2383 domain-containing protein [Bacteriovoracaceae bacterium]
MKVVLMFLALSVCLITNAKSTNNDLIQEEMAAVQNYKQVIEKVKDHSELSQLRLIQQNHSMAVEILRKYVTFETNLKTKTAGVWGAFTKAYTGSAKLFGNSSAMRALRQVEIHGLEEYREYLKNEKVDPKLKADIRNKLIPMQELHIKTISRFI